MMSAIFYITLYTWCVQFLLVLHTYHVGFKVAPFLAIYTILHFYHVQGHVLEYTYLYLLFGV